MGIEQRAMFSSSCSVLKNPARLLLSRGRKIERVQYQVGVPDRGDPAHPLADVPIPRFLRAPKSVEINGVPFTFGQPMLGLDMGPDLIRECGLRAALSELGWQIKDNGDLDLVVPTHDDPASPIINGYAVGQMNKKVAETVSRAAKEGFFHLLIGGDHSVGAGTLAGILEARPDTGVIWVDAHADINTPESSPSGNAHGMPVALNIPGLCSGDLAGFEWLTPRLDPKQIVYIGLRDIDKQERRIIRETGVHVFTMHDVDRHGIGPVMAKALEILGDRPLHMSYDIDGVDPAHAPATGTISRGGLTYREALYIAEIVGMSGRLGSLDLVEVNPSLADDDGARETADLALKIIASAMGSSLL